MMLDDAIDTVDEVFAVFGEPAAYRSPADIETPDIVVVPWTPREDRTRPGSLIGGFGLAERAQFLLVRKAQVAAPEAGGAFTVQPAGAPAGTWRIGEDAPVAHDGRGLVWRCAVVAEV